MPGERSEVRVRPARHDDYGGVMDINKQVYHGIDYLPYMYHHYIRHPQAHCYVAELDGKIVGFSIAYLMDEGQRVVSMARRTAPSAQGQGIMSELIHGKHSHTSHLMKCHPQLTTHAFATGAAVHYEKIADCTPGTTIIDKWYFLAYTINGDTYKSRNPALSQFEGIDIQIPSPDELDNLLRDKRQIADLFGDDKYLVCLYSWFPLPLTEGSLLYMAKHYWVNVSALSLTVVCWCTNNSSNGAML